MSKTKLVAICNYFELIFSFKIKENKLNLLCGLGVIFKKTQGSKYKN